MPSAASVKVEKLPANNSANNVAATSAATLVDCVDNNSPIRQALVIIEHKIRNLEKRKSKLESYRDNEKSGKELSADQKVAVSKYNEVAMTLEFAREFSKQIAQIVSISEKDLKKKQKKDETSKRQGETSKIREVLIIQDVVKRLSDESVRKDFLEGTNGACKLDEADFDVLDVFSEKIVPQRPLEVGGVPFKTAAQKSADILLLTIDGKQKDFESSSYAHVKNLLKNIQKCVYFDKGSMPETEIEADVVEATEVEPYADEKFESNVETTNTEIATDAINTIAETQASDITDESSGEPFTDLKNGPETFNSTTGSHHNVVGNIQFHEAPCAAAVPVPTFATTPLQQQQTNLLTSPEQQHANHDNANVSLPPTQVPPGGHQVIGGHQLLRGEPTTVRAVEQAYFKQHHSYIQQQMRPLAEVLGAGNFYFLQESELDSPEVNSMANNSPANLHTNQSFPNVVYIKPPVDIAQQAVNQMPGFATPNAPIPIPIVQPTPLAMASPLQQQPPQPTISSTNPAQIIIQYSDADKFISASTIPISKITSSDGVGVTSVLRSNIVSLKPSDIVVEQRVPEISEWKPEEAVVPTNKSSKHHSNSKELADCTNGNSTWRDPYSSNKNSQESNEWNGGGGSTNVNETGQDESNTWTSGGGGGGSGSGGGGGGSTQRYQRFQHGSGSYGRNNRSSGNAGRNNNGTGNNANTLSSSTNTNGYRSRPNSNGSNTFYRNNDPYYQNGGSRGGADQKSDNYGRGNGNNFRGRDSRGENNGTAASSSYKPLPQRNNNQNANNNSNRLNGNGNHRNTGASASAGRNPLSAHQSTGINA